MQGEVCRVTMGHLSLTIGYLKATVVYFFSKQTLGNHNWASPKSKANLFLLKFNCWLKKFHVHIDYDSIKVVLGTLGPLSRLEETHAHPRRPSSSSTPWAYYYFAIFPILLWLLSKISFSSIGVVSLVSYWWNCYFLGTRSCHWCYNDYRYTYVVVLA